MSHYFTDNSNLKQNRKVIPFRFLDIEYKLISDDGVFSKNDLDRGTEALLKVVVKQDLSGHIGDLGCGIGTVGVILSQHFDIEVTGVDVNARAVDLANMNFETYQVNGRNIVGDGIKGSFDAIVSNPPIRVGKDIMYRLFEDAYHALKRDGSFYFVIRKSHGAKSAHAKCIELFGNCELLKKDKGFYIYKAKRLT